MSNSVTFWLLLAVLGFWAMGAYNRLVRLRSQGLQAFASLEVLFNQFILLVKTNSPLPVLHPDPVEAGFASDESARAWLALLAATEALGLSLKAMRTQPLNGVHAPALASACASLLHTWTDLQHLPQELAGPEFSKTLQLQWQHVAVQAELARTEFNRVVLSYNAAIHQFPALLLARLVGFKAALPLEPHP